MNPMLPEGEDALPSLSDWHDYEPNLEFDDTELHPTVSEESKNIFFYSVRCVAQDKIDAFRRVFYYRKMCIKTNNVSLVILHDIIILLNAHYVLFNAH